MPDGGLSSEEYERRIAELEALVATLAAANEALTERVADLERQLGQNSGNSGKPPSRDPAAERQRQAAQRQAKASAHGGKRRRGKQRGAKGAGLVPSPNPDEIVDRHPEACGGCGERLDPGDDAGGDAGGFQARQVIEIPEIAPTVTEHRAHRRRCGCGHTTIAAFPDGVRGVVSYGPRARAFIAYLLARQHLPNRRVAETMTDLFGLPISTGTIDAIYHDASNRLKGFMAALVAVLRALPVLHADETTDRVGTLTCWMHVVSTSMFTLIHASTTRGAAAFDEAGVLPGYRGVIVHDRLAMYWKLKAKHGVCGAHLLRDLAEVAIVATQTGWATGLAALLVEINHACNDARDRGLKQLAPAAQRRFATRYDTLVAAGHAANPDPSPGRKRDRLQRGSHNLATAFTVHRPSILRYMYNLDVGFTNNQAERDLRPSKLHRKISGCFRSNAGAERFARLRSYLSTTRKHDLAAIDALTRLFNGDPWMPAT